MRAKVGSASITLPVAIALLALPAVATGVDTKHVLWLGIFGLLIGYAVSVDLTERRIPNRLTYGGTLGALSVAALSGIDGFTQAAAGALLATALGGLAWWLGRGALGLGDVKFSTLVGAFVGLPGVVPYLLIGSMAGAAIALALLASGRGHRATFPYGPALAIGAVGSLYVTSFSMAIR